MSEALGRERFFNCPTTNPHRLPPVKGRTSRSKTAGGVENTVSRSQRKSVPAEYEHEMSEAGKAGQLDARSVGP